MIVLLAAAFVWAAAVLAWFAGRAADVRAAAVWVSWCTDVDDPGDEQHERVYDYGLDELEAWFALPARNHR